LSEEKFAMAKAPSPAREPRALPGQYRARQQMIAVTAVPVSSLSAQVPARLRKIDNRGMFSRFRPDGCGSLQKK